MKKTLFIFCFLIFVLKANSQNQNFEWALKVGSNSDFNSTEMTQDVSGNIYIIGNFHGTGDFDPGIGVYNMTSSGDEDLFVVKLNPSEAFIGAVKFGGAGWDGGTSIAIDINQDILITGAFNSTVDFDPSGNIFNLTAVPFGYSDAFICKIDSQFNFIWAGKFGGFQDEFCESIRTDNSGNIYSIGSFGGIVDFDPGPGIFSLNSASGSLYIVKLDSSCTFIWAKQLGNLPGCLACAGVDLNIDIYNDLIITGVFYGPCDFDPGINTSVLTGVLDIFVTKLDSSGAFAWAKAFLGSDLDVSSAIITDNIGNIFLTGQFKYIVDFDPGTSVLNLFSNGLDDIFIVKLDILGNLVWVRQIGGIEEDFGQTLMHDYLGNIYVAGYFNNTVDFDPNAGTYNLTANSRNGFILKLDTASNMQWVLQYGGGGSIWTFQSTLINSNLEIYSTGTFYGVIDFDPGIAVFNLTAGTNGDMFVHKLSLTTGILEINNQANLILYPNPSNKEILINNLNKNIFSYSIFNGQGIELIKQENGTENKAIDVSGLNNGLYFIKLNFLNDESRLMKFIKVD